jgi:hypothetical protein
MLWEEAIRSKRPKPWGGFDRTKMEGASMHPRRLRHSAAVVVIAMPFVLGACARQAQAPTEQPDPPSWFVGEEDKTTPAPPAMPEAHLVPAFESSTLVAHGGLPQRVENRATGIHPRTRHVRS